MSYNNETPNNETPKKGEIFVCHVCDYVEFYEILELSKSGKSIKIRELSTDITIEGYRTGTSLPKKAYAYNSKVITKKLDNNTFFIRHNRAERWDGHPVHWIH